MKLHLTLPMLGTFCTLFVAPLASQTFTTSVPNTSGAVSGSVSTLFTTGVIFGLPLTASAIRLSGTGSEEGRCLITANHHLNRFGLAVECAELGPVASVSETVRDTGGGATAGDRFELNVASSATYPAGSRMRATVAVTRTGPVFGFARFSGSSLSVQTLSTPQTLDVPATSTFTVSAQGIASVVGTSVAATVFVDYYRVVSRPSAMPTGCAGTLSLDYDRAVASGSSYDEIHVATVTGAQNGPAILSLSVSDAPYTFPGTSCDVLASSFATIAMTPDAVTAGTHHCDVPFPASLSGLIYAQAVHFDPTATILQSSDTLEIEGL